jgi:hypothetical protein
MTAAPSAPAALLCSDADAAADDDPRGSAATFTSFLLIEHLAAFGREAADDAVRAVYAQDTTAVTDLPGLRPFAIRPVGRSTGTGSRVRWIGRTGPHAFLQPVPATPTVSQLADLAASPRPGGHAAGPLFAVCTNGSRDRCCAIKGRDLAAELDRTLDAPGADPTVVEISHLGGHRYAPTMLVLPFGYAYAWLDIESALDVAAAARDGLVHPGGLRGRADLPPAAQAAEAYWRAQVGPAPVDAVHIIDVDVDRDLYRVTARVDGRTETTRMRHVPGATIGATACGGKPIATGRWTVV